MVSSDGLSLGRSLAELKEPWIGEDKAFGSVRVDESEITNATYRHCTFVNVSFKDATLRDSTFFDCTFIDCYFRNTIMRESKFVGCRFIDSQFHKVEVSGCDFRYARFDRCLIDSGEMAPSLPSEPNLREELAVGLAVAAEEQGQSKQARAYRIIATKARQEHLKAAVKGNNSWYRDHFPGAERYWAALRWFGGKLNGWIWGHGESWLVLARNLLILTLLVFPILYWISSAGLNSPSGTISASDYVGISVATVLSVGDVSSVQLVSPAARTIAAVAAFTGLVAAGLFVTILFRRVTRR